MNKKVKELDSAYNLFITSKNELKHRQSIESIFAKIGLKSKFKRELQLGSEQVIEVFKSFKKVTRKDCISDVEYQSLKKVGRLFTEYAAKNRYDKFSDLAFSLVLQNTIDLLGLQKKSNFKEYTITDLYEKKLLPNGIFLQFFILETLANNKVYKWNRNQTIIDQSLVCLTVCFEDIYDFLNQS
ncbi:hypothetical protein C4577_07225 [Candidatus Parcubacteria bacterium]|nr:MAG: hypothetical protein C4577_07225 [Candidatus Parcubacteria bacterium]